MCNNHVPVFVRFRWSGIDPVTVQQNEEFDPLDGVSAIGCNNQPATVELLTPTLYGVQDWWVPLNTSFYPLYGVSAVGINEDEDIDVYSDWDYRNERTAGEYPITYWAVDNAGNYVSETATVNVLEEEEIPLKFTAYSAAETLIDEVEVFYVKINREGYVETIIQQIEGEASTVITLPETGHTLENISHFMNAINTDPHDMFIALMDCNSELDFSYVERILSYSGDCINVQAVISSGDYPVIGNIEFVYSGTDDSEESEGE